jgi:tRNA dimethylallyltransferase
MALAERYPLEIVSVDSAQVYRGMDIGTAKPRAAERARVPHHLIDLVDPDQRYSAGQFRADAIQAVMEVLSRNRLPLLVGGTMLYYRTLVSGLDELPPGNKALREEIDAQALQRGWPAMHEELARIDPQAARRIMPNDAQRIQRALEVFRITGKPLSALHGATRSTLPFELKGACLMPERAQLHRTIEQRFDAMLREGLVEELRLLRSRFSLTPDMPSMRAVGYRQAWSLLDGEIDQPTMRETAIAATRQLAKRQMTWLRSFAGLARLDAAVRPEEAGPLLFHSFL